MAAGVLEGSRRRGAWTKRIAMIDDTRQRIEAQFTKHPVTKAEGVPEGEIDLAASDLGMSFPEDYREFLQRYGGGIVGQYPILGLRKAEAMASDTWSVVAITKEYRLENWAGVDKWLVISVDQAGN